MKLLPYHPRTPDTFRSFGHHFRRVANLP